MNEQTERYQIKDEFYSYFILPMLHLKRDFGFDYSVRYDHERNIYSIISWFPIEDLTDASRRSKIKKLMEDNLLKYEIRGDFILEEESEILDLYIKENKYSSFVDEFDRIIGLDRKAAKAIKELWSWFPIFSIQESHFVTSAIHLDIEKAKARFYEKYNAS